MNSEADIVERLDHLIALLRVGFADRIDKLREDLRTDPVSSAILDAVAEGWLSSGELQRSVSKTAKVSDRTVLRSLNALAERGLLDVRGSGRSTSYRSSGIL